MYQGDLIDRYVVFERDGWVCNICRTEIDRTLRCPDPLAATLDHVVPLSKGGQHVWSNVAPAHLYCNQQKADTVLDWTGLPHVC